MLVLLGLILGLLSATVSESFFHMFFGHPFEAVKKFYFKNTNLFAACLKPYYQHFVIHHKKTYLNHFFSQFDSKEHKERVDQWIDENFQEDFKKLIWIERYNLTLKGFIGTLPFAGPFCIGPALILYFLGIEAFLGSLLTAYIPVWMSKYIHPLIHAPEETHLHGPFVRWFMKTNYAERVLLNHFLHHNDGDKNFNLFLGGDRLIGLHRSATPAEMIEYNQLLLEFRAKVGNPVTEGLSKEKVTLASLKEELISTYCNQQAPSTNERFDFQKKLFSLKKKFADQHWDYEGFGFSLYSKNIDYKDWTKRKEFSLSGYESNQNEVLYRGNKFKTGDILLTNQSSDADGLFSTLLDRDINFAHAAVFINLQYLSESFPAVLEINEYGTRAVPLKSFLAREFNSYIEVFRPKKELTSIQQESLIFETKRFLEETHAFDIYQDRTQDHYLNCARTIELIYKRAEIPLEIGDSKYHHATYTNLHTLGIQDSIGKMLLMPDDYALNGQFNIVGAIANSTIEDMLARNLTRAYFQNIWRTKILNPQSFPVSEKFKFHMIKLIQKNGLASRALLSFLGMSFDEFPSGPATFMSLVTFGDSTMISAVKRVKEELSSNVRADYLNKSWDEIYHHPEMTKVLEDATSRFSTIFTAEHQVTKQQAIGAELVGIHNVIQ